MNSLITSPEVVAALIALFGVITSVVFSYLISTNKVKYELDKFEKTSLLEYEKKHIDIRLVAYQSLWQILTELNKNKLNEVFEAEILENHIRNVLTNLENWYKENGITLSKNTYGRFSRLCSYLGSYIKMKKFNNPADLHKMRKHVWNLRQMMKKDLHIEEILPKNDKIK